MKSYAYDVFLNGKEIDTVFMDGLSNGNPVMSKDVKKSLVDHDGYDPNINVYRRGLTR